jgi:hypothetical protein
MSGSNTLPAPSNEEVNKIIASRKVDMSSWGDALSKIKDSPEQTQTQTKEFAEVKDFDRRQLSRIIEAKTGRNFSENASDKQILGVLVPAGVATQEGLIEVSKLIDYSQSRWDKYNGKPFNAKTLGDANTRYIQNLLGVSEDGVIGPRTMNLAVEAGIVSNGRLNTQAVKIIDSKDIKELDRESLTRQVEDGVTDPQKAQKITNQTKAQNAAKAAIGTPAWGMGTKSTTPTSTPTPTSVEITVPNPKTNNIPTR